MQLLSYCLVQRVQSKVSEASVIVVQAQKLEAHQAAMNAELNAIRKAVADDNEEFVVKGVKGVSAAQELISKSYVH